MAKRQLIPCRCSEFQRCHAGLRQAVQAADGTRERWRQHRLRVLRHHCEFLLPSKRLSLFTFLLANLTLYTSAKTGLPSLLNPSNYSISRPPACSYLLAALQEGTNTRVMGSAKNALATKVATRQDLTWVIPDSWSLAEAATVPTAYMTAYYSMVMRGRVAKGKKVLIHSGTGAVGMAAIQICLNRGAEVGLRGHKPFQTWRINCVCILHDALSLAIRNLLMALYCCQE